jgi:hypothetical protein
VKAQRIHIYSKDQQTKEVCIGSQIKKKTTDYIQRQEVTYFYNSPHKFRGISINIYMYR